MVSPIRPAGMPTLVHIGLPKTATTSLQALFMTDPELVALGGGAGRAPGEDGRDFIEPLVFGDRETFERDALPAAAAVGSGRATDAPLVLSDEILSLANQAKVARTWSVDAPIPPARTAERLAGILPDAHILMVLRAQPDLVASHFLQMQRVDAVRTDFDTWLRHGLTDEGAAALDPMLDYAALYDAYASAFGAERTHVYLFEEIRTDLTAFVGEVFALLGRPAPAREAIDVHLNRRGGVHPRLRRAAARLVPLDRLKTRAPRLFATGKALMPKQTARVGITHDQARAIADRYGPGNQRLSQRLGRALPEAYPRA